MIRKRHSRFVRGWIWNIVRVLFLATTWWFWRRWLANSLTWRASIYWIFRPWALWFISLLILNLFIFRRAVIILLIRWVIFFSFFILFFLLLELISLFEYFITIIRRRLLWPATWSSSSRCSLGALNIIDLSPSLRCYTLWIRWCSVNLFWSFGSTLWIWNSSIWSLTNLNIDIRKSKKN